MFGVELLNGSDKPEAVWNITRTEGARRAVVDVSNKLSRVTGKDPLTAFRDAFSTYGQNLVMKKVGSYDVTVNGVTTPYHGGGVTRGAHFNRICLDRL